MLQTKFDAELRAAGWMPSDADPAIAIDQRQWWFPKEYENVGWIHFKTPIIGVKPDSSELWLTHYDTVGLDPIRVHSVAEALAVVVAHLLESQ